MANVDEPAKLLLPYLQRADELQKHEPLVAYYCRLYAMERGLSIPQTERTKTTNALLVSLMKQLEKDKKSLKLAPDDHLHVEGFALNVLEKADKQDRAGRANLNTAKTFYAASIFFEILNQFGELQPDLEQKQKYAVWKAADIRKAVKEGRKPVPGPPGGDTDLSIPSSTSSVEYDLEPSRGDAAPKFAPEPSLPPQFYDEGNSQHPEDVPPSPSNNSPQPSPYPTASYPSHDLHPPSNNRSETTSYPQPYHHQPYSQEPQPQFPQNYPSPEVPSYSYPNFQSYPSFAESSLPTAPSHYPSYHQGSDHSYTNSESAQYNLNSRNGTPYSESAPAPTIPNHHISAQFNSNVRSRSAYENVPPPVQTYQYDSNYQPPPEKIVEAPTIPNNHMPAQFNSSVRNGSAYENAPPPVQTYQYDSNYQPPPEKIAEAHKAARFAVGALAFDDVSTAVDHLKKSLELLTNPSTGQ